jgi:hypothetical protein
MRRAILINAAVALFSCVGIACGLALTEPAGESSSSLSTCRFPYFGYKQNSAGRATFAFDCAKNWFTAGRNISARNPGAEPRYVLTRRQSATSEFNAASLGSLDFQPRFSTDAPFCNNGADNAAGGTYGSCGGIKVKAYTDGTNQGFDMQFYLVKDGNRGDITSLAYPLIIHARATDGIWYERCKGSASDGTPTNCKPLTIRSPP